MKTSDSAIAGGSLQRATLSNGDKSDTQRLSVSVRVCVVTPKNVNCSFQGSFSAQVLCSKQAYNNKECVSESKKHGTE